MAVQFEEMADSPQIRFHDGRFVATRVFKVDWSDRLSFLVELYGGYRFVGGQFTFTPPATFPGVPQAIVTEVEIDPFPPDRPDGDHVVSLSAPTNAYLHALVAATYEIPFDLGNNSRADLPKVPNGTYLTYRADLGADRNSTPGRSWRWNIAGTPALAGDRFNGQIVPTEDFTLTWHRVPRPPWSASADLRGKVNGSTFLSHAPQSVLYMGVRTRRDFQVLDSGLWRLEYHFKVREVKSTVDPSVLYGWNRSFREQADAGEHWLEVIDESGNPTYASGDLEQLFQFE